jgi:dTDP-4-dehydrorhamnose 3,5-epimerase
MKVSKSPIDGLIIIEPKVFRDSRGLFYEVYSESRYKEHGVPARFVQDNHSVSEKGVLRGLHYQVNPGQDKLVRVVRGEVFDVAVDIRKGSLTYGKWWGLSLSETNNLQLYIPVGFAHGFCVLSDSAEVLYKCSDYYSPQNERGIIWNDPDLAIDWPIENPILSEKDIEYPNFVAL